MYRRKFIELSTIGAWIACWFKPKLYDIDTIDGWPAFKNSDTVFLASATMFEVGDKISIWNSSLDGLHYYEVISKVDEYTYKCRKHGHRIHNAG